MIKSFDTDELRSGAKVLNCMPPSAIEDMMDDLLLWADEIDSLRTYADCLARGLSDSEARGTAWPEDEKG